MPTSKFYRQRMTRIARISFCALLCLLLFYVFINGFHGFHGFIFSLSPDATDEPDGWRNVLSGSSGLSGDYKTTYFTTDNLYNQCNLLTKENFVLSVLSVGNNNFC